MHEVLHNAVKPLFAMIQPIIESTAPQTKGEHSTSRPLTCGHRLLLFTYNEHE